jgi:hypothetical protein
LVELYETDEEERMSQLAIERGPDGSASIFDVAAGRRYEREVGGDGTVRWVKKQGGAIKKVSSRRALRLERLYRHPEKAKVVRRFPRSRTAEDLAFFRTSDRIVELETEARAWIGRGREANIQLGRILQKLKALVGHGNFEKYFESKFGQPYGIAFRTAQAYMRLAREADQETKSAGPALFDLATDPHAVAIREAAERARQTVADAAEDGSSDSTTSDAAVSANPICIFRPYIRMTRAQRDTIAPLWKSEHRHSVDNDVTNYLLKLCEKYEITHDDSADSSD